jgi:hypothetical protein
MTFRFIHFAAVAMVALAWANLASGSDINEATKRGDLEKVRALLQANPALAFGSGRQRLDAFTLSSAEGFQGSSGIAACLQGSHQCQEQEGRYAFALGGGKRAQGNRDIAAGQ